MAAKPERRRYDPRLSALLGLAGVAATLGCIATVVTVFVSTTTVRNGRAIESAVCAVTDYAQRQAGVLRTGTPAHDGIPARPANPAAATQLDALAHRMRATGIHCAGGMKVAPSVSGAVLVLRLVVITLGAGFMLMLPRAVFWPQPRPPYAMLILAAVELVFASALLGTIYAEADVKSFYWYGSPVLLVALVLGWVYLWSAWRYYRHHRHGVH